MAKGCSYAIVCTLPNRLHGSVFGMPAADFIYNPVQSHSTLPTKVLVQHR